jgi:hypothetical protein
MLATTSLASYARYNQLSLEIRCDTGYSAYGVYSLFMCL